MTSEAIVRGSRESNSLSIFCVRLGEDSLFNLSLKSLMIPSNRFERKYPMYSFYRNNIANFVTSNSCLLTTNHYLFEVLSHKAPNFVCEL